MVTSLLRPKTRHNPLFYGDQARLLLGEQRCERALTERASTTLLTWNVFASLDTHRDRDYLAYRLQSLGGSDVAAPVRTSLFTGRDREPLLHPSAAYLTDLAETVGDDDSVGAYREPVEVPVRIEAPTVLILVDTALDEYPRGAGGRDRLVELIDGGLEHARRLDKTLAVAVVYQSGTGGAAGLSARINDLRDPASLAAAMPWRRHVPAVVLRELPWHRLLGMWEQETAWLDLAGQPVKAFREHTRAIGLR